MTNGQVTGAAREKLREKGQFWTPAWVADAMVRYVMQDNPPSIFDPAVGGGAFFVAAKRLGKDCQLLGYEIDAAAIEKAHRDEGLSTQDLANVAIADFMLQPPTRTYPAIVGNPPYIRHHRLSAELKAATQQLTWRVMGTGLDGRTGLHVFFLIQALNLLSQAGRLAFIMPADTCEGVFAPRLWRWIAQHFRIEAVLTFSGDASPFPRVDTNPIIFFLSNNPLQDQLIWAKCLHVDADLCGWVDGGFRLQSPGLWITERPLTEALQTGLSRPPAAESTQVVLGDFVRVMRGVATGANEFFFLTQAQADFYQLPPEFLKPAIGRTRDVLTEELTDQTLAHLAAEGRPTQLFAPDGRPLAEFPTAVQTYLLKGEAQGLPTKALISQRRPWYKMENRPIPPFLFAYLGRRNSRFIRNLAGVIPLTSFLCVYPHAETPIESLWVLLRHPSILENLARVGKSYGGDAVKVEPRALEQLPLNADVLAALDLSPIRLTLF